MRAADLKNKTIAIWGVGHEGRAAAAFLRKHLPKQPLIFLDENEGPDKVKGDLPADCTIVRGVAKIEVALNDVEILVKSPGVSLYHPLIRRLGDKKVPVTSLLNLWLAEPHRTNTIGITGTKGKSTTSSLLAHVLNGIGKKTAIGGNIGLPVTEIDGNVFDYAVIEVSSYQATDLVENFDLVILTSLQPEHLDWHGSPEKYYGDKLNLLAHAKTKIVNEEALDIARRHGLMLERLLPFNRRDAFHVHGGKIHDGDMLIGAPQNSYLTRPHNLSNVCAVLTVIKFLKLDVSAALQAMQDFKPLPHRQQELGEKNGVLFVNDSIATAPHAAIAALDVYKDRPVTLIAGGFDRGIDYAPLVDYVVTNNIYAVICMGPSGQRIYDALAARQKERIFKASSMQEAAALAKSNTPENGVVLLSPAAPSYGLFRDFVERGEAFATESGFGN